MKGDVTYNGYGFDECIVGRTAAYVDQNDNHIAELTVRETLVSSINWLHMEIRCHLNYAQNHPDTLQVSDN